MAAYLALLRAVNVGGTGKLPMSELVALCEAEGLSSVKTYIQSGNVVFESRAGESTVEARLEKALARKMGKSVGVLVRTATEIDHLLEENPFSDVPPNRVLAFFYPGAAPKVGKGTPSPGGERLRASGRHLFVHYPNGQGKSKLKIPQADTCTGRNLNTLNKLAIMLRDLA